MLTICHKISKIPDEWQIERSLLENSNRKLRSTFSGSPFIPVGTNQTECVLLVKIPSSTPHTVVIFLMNFNKCLLRVNVVRFILGP